MSLERVQSGPVERRDDTKAKHSPNRRTTSEDKTTATQITFDMLMAAFALRSIGPSQIESGQKKTTAQNQRSVAEPSQYQPQGQILRPEMSNEQKQVANLFSTPGGADISALISGEPKAIATYSELATTAPLDATLKQIDSKNSDSKLVGAIHDVNDQEKKDGLLRPNLIGVPDQMGTLGLEQPVASPAQHHAPTTGSMPLSPGQQIAEHVRVILERGDREATLRLEPAELGKVRIHLSLDNGQVHLSIQAEQQSTNRLLQQRISDLRTNLDAQGVKVGNLSVIDQHHGKDVNGVMRDHMLHQVKTTPGTASGDFSRDFTGHAAPDFGGHGFGQHGHNQQTFGGQLETLPFDAESTRLSHVQAPTLSTIWVTNQGWLTGIDAYV